MTRTALWIVGEPAAGKSTVARKLLGFDRSNMTVGRQKWCLGDGWMAPGHYPAGETHFDGADQVGMSQARDYLEQYLATPEHLKPRRGILLDGARFSTRPCFDLLAQTHLTRICFVSASAVECANRRDARGWTPDPKWLKGAITRAERFRDYALAHGAQAGPL